MINNIIGEKSIDLTHSIKNFGLSKEVAPASMFSDNILYEFMEPWTIELESGNKQVTAGTYTRRELIDLIERKIKLTQLDKNPRINRTNKLKGITEMFITLGDLDNTNNLEN